MRRAREGSPCTPPRVERRRSGVCAMSSPSSQRPASTRDAASRALSPQTRARTNPRRQSASSPWTTMPRPSATCHWERPQVSVRASPSYHPQLAWQSDCTRRTLMPSSCMLGYHCSDEQLPFPFDDAAGGCSGAVTLGAGRHTTALETGRPLADRVVVAVVVRRAPGAGGQRPNSDRRIAESAHRRTGHFRGGSTVGTWFRVSGAVVERPCH